MLPLTEWRLQHCSLRGIRAIRLVVASSNSLLSSDSLETGTGSSNSLLSANQSPHFAYILERAENSARNAAFFPPETHRREPAHAGFARFGEHSLRASCASRQHRDLRAHAAEAHRDVASDAAGSAGYQDGSIAKIAGAQHFRRSRRQLSVSTLVGCARVPNNRRPPGLTPHFPPRIGRIEPTRKSKRRADCAQSKAFRGRRNKSPGLVPHASAAGHCG
jgi:hypothetical protein